jgi:hypothetical protein
MPRLLRLALAVALLALIPAHAADAVTTSRSARLKDARCVPARHCARTPAVAIGKQVQLVGRGLYAGQRVTFRWSRGALATKLHRSRAGYVARVPAGTAAGTALVYVRDRAGRRSNAKHVRVVAPRRRGPLVGGDGALPAAFRGNGMWIWQLDHTENGDVAAIIARARAAAMSTLFVKAADGGTRWAQLTPALVAQLHDAGLRVCGWQFVYGADPAAEAAAATATLATGIDCFVIDAETKYEGRYAAAQRYMTALRAATGPDFPLGLTSFPYVDYHPNLPYSVFLGPGGAQVNLPQIYWRAFKVSPDSASVHTFAHNRVYGRAIAPLGQTYDHPPDADIQRFRQVWASYGAGGLSWWSWQSTAAGTWTALGQAAPAPVALSDPGWPALGKGAKGDEVVWLQQHLATADPTVAINGTLDAAGVAALQRFQSAQGLPPTGVTDPPTWEAALRLAVTPVDWTARSR